MTDTGRLRTLLGGPDTAWLVQRVRRRLESGRGVGQTLTLQAPSDAQREAVARLFGHRVASGAVVTVRLSELDAILRRAELCDGIIDAVIRLTGPISDLGAKDREVKRLWRDLFDENRAQVERRIARTNGAAVLGWLDDVRTTGLLRRLARNDPEVGRQLLEQALKVRDLLPAAGLSLAELAAVATGDSHALDRGAPLGTIVFRLASALGHHDHTRDSLSHRDVWANVGVLCDELSAPVLTLNLRASASTSVGKVLALHADGGEPHRLSTRQLLREPPDFVPVMAGRTVYICENPAVVATAANQLGARSAPLVCVEGQIKTAARLLMLRLATAGADLAYHGDFDWGGVRIANVVMSHCRARPWRYSSADYRGARPGVALRGRAVTAIWDPELEPAMVAAGYAVHEEQVLGALLEDLESDVTSTGLLAGRRSR